VNDPPEVPGTLPAGSSSGSRSKRSFLVTGTNPPYSHNPTKWDCTSGDPKLHWANDNERYCYSDWRQIVSAITAVPHVIVTDPLSAGVAFGRPASYPLP